MSEMSGWCIHDVHRENSVSKRGTVGVWAGDNVRRRTFMSGKCRTVEIRTVGTKVSQQKKSGAMKNTYKYSVGFPQKVRL